MTTSSEKLEYQAWCKTCQQVLDQCPNGNFVHGAALRHLRENPGHEVIVGYVVTEGQA